MKRSKFNLSHYKIGTCDMGKLVPISLYEVLPGDTVRQSTSVFLRFQPMLAPVMHPIRVTTYTFYVPTRLLWENFEDFITGGPDGLNVSTPPTLQNPTNGIGEGSLENYLGVPVGYKGPFSMLPDRAYYKIWYEYFRDQDLDNVNLNEGYWKNMLGTGDATATSASQHPLRSVSWEKDYFTTARPWPQKGAEVSVPVNGLSGSQTITISPDNNKYPTFKTGFGNNGYPTTNAVNLMLKSSNPLNEDQSANQRLYQMGTDEGVNTTWSPLEWETTGLTATLSNSNNGIGSVQLNDLREAFALQRFEEARAMYGSRYTEYLRYLGVRSSDARLQRPEYLGGSRQTIQMSEVLQTAADGTTPVGTLRGHGIGASKSRPFRRFIEEHGFIMTLMVVRPIAVYMQGIPKLWSRSVKEDYWQKELQHIGQQEVLNKELYALGENPDGVFGYQNRYDDYRSVQSSICGEMQSVLNYWHMARDFANEPVLNASFITGSPTKRIFAEQTMNEVLFMASHSVVARRLLSKTGNPIM